MTKLCKKVEELNSNELKRYLNPGILNREIEEVEPNTIPDINNILNTIYSNKDDQSNYYKLKLLLFGKLMSKSSLNT